MSFQPVPITAEVRLLTSQNGAGKLYQNSLYFTKEGGWDAGDIDDLANAAAGAWAIQIVGVVPPEGALEEVIARDLSTEFGAVSTVVVTTGGTDATAYASVNNAVYVKFLGSGGSAPRDGGIFHPFVRESAVDGVGSLTAWRTTVSASYQGLVDSIIAAMDDPTMLHVIVSRNSKSAWMAAHPAATEAEIKAASPWPRDNGVVNPVTSIVPRAQVASQRDRRS